MNRRNPVAYKVSEDFYDRWKEIKMVEFIIFLIVVAIVFYMSKYIVDSIIGRTRANRRIEELEHELYSLKVELINARQDDSFASFASFARARKRQEEARKQQEEAIRRAYDSFRGQQEDWAYRARQTQERAHRRQQEEAIRPSKADIKKKYKADIKTYHPDRVIARGGSEAEVKEATEKMQKINEQYERDMKHYS